MMHLTSTVVGSSQANRQDSCEEKAGIPSHWATTSPEPNSSQDPQTQVSSPFPLPGMAEGREQGARRPPGSEVGETTGKSVEKNVLHQSQYSLDTCLCEVAELTGEPERGT